MTRSSVKQGGVNAEALAKLWNIGVDTAKKTIQYTTQKGIRSTLHPIERRFCTKQAQLRYRQLAGRHGSFYTDTFFSKVPSLNNFKMAQIYVNDLSFTKVYPMKVKSEAGDTLQTFIHDIGIPHSIRSDDAPVRFREAGGFYSPKNYGGGFSGPVSLRSALMQSLNIPAVVLGRRVGINKVIEVCRLLGFESPLIAVTSLPLGSVDVTPLEMAGAYATFASNGWHSKPTFIMRVTDSRGNVMLDNTPKPKLVLDPWATASLNSVLQGVIQGGTATSAQIGRPAAGKTGTTDNEKNVWFVGYVPQLATAVWIGDDRNRTLGKGITGGGFAAPIWRDFMAQALKNERVEYFPSPSKFRKPTVK